MAEFPTELEYEIDNRDLYTTWLQLKDNQYVEVNPFDLVLNAIENAIINEDSAPEILKMFEDFRIALEARLEAEEIKILSS